MSGTAKAARTIFWNRQDAKDAKRSQMNRQDAKSAKIFFVVSKGGSTILLRYDCGHSKPNKKQ